jgi:hypothetical protein
MLSIKAQPFVLSVTFFAGFLLAERIAGVRPSGEFGLGLGLAMIDFFYFAIRLLLALLGRQQFPSAPAVSL